MPGFSPGVDRRVLSGAKFDHENRRQVRRDRGAYRNRFSEIISRPQHAKMPFPAVIYELRLFLFLFVHSLSLSVCVYLHIQHTIPINQSINQSIKPITTTTTTITNHHHHHHHHYLSSADRLIDPRGTIQKYAKSKAAGEEDRVSFCIRQISTSFFLRPVLSTRSRIVVNVIYQLFIFLFISRCLTAVLFCLVIASNCSSVLSVLIYTHIYFIAHFLSSTSFFFFFSFISRALCCRSR